MLKFIRRLPLPLAVGGAVAVIAAASGGYAYALTSSSVLPQPAGTVYACVTAKGAATFETRAVKCPSGDVLWHWAQAGPKGATGAAGKTGPAGPQGKTGPQGPAGTSAILTVSASTAVSAWPESSGWATDNFTRNVTLTREGAVPASDCGSSATSCWLYTETLADNGSFTTVDGHASPNGSSTATIKGAWTGTMTGGGKLEFLASSGSPDPKLVPGTANGSAKPQTTTAWYKLFFPASTSFGLTGGPSVPWLTYDWNYAVTVTCGTASTVSENWSDAIVPGDDGQGAADGNVTGSTACPAG